MCGQMQTKQIGYMLAANIKGLVHPKYLLYCEQFSV